MHHFKIQKVRKSRLVVAMTEGRGKWGVTANGNGVSLGAIKMF